MKCHEPWPWVDTEAGETDGRQMISSMAKQYRILDLWTLGYVVVQLGSSCCIVRRGPIVSLDRVSCASF